MSTVVFNMTLNEIVDALRTEDLEKLRRFAKDQQKDKRNEQRSKRT